MPSFGRYISSFLSLLLVCSFASCESIQIDEPDTPDTPPTSGLMSSVKVLTRADQGEPLYYPLNVYGFSDEGTLIAHQQLSSPQDELQLTLPQAMACHIIAVSADEAGYQLPSSVTPSSVITMLPPVLGSDVPSFATAIAQGYSTASPLQLGSADVLPQSDKATVSIQLHYQVASLNVTLQGLPSSCTSAYLSVASPFSSLTLEGHGSGSQTSRIPLTLTNDKTGEWSTTSPVCLFPTSGNTTFTIAYNDAEGEQYSSVSYLAPLRAGTPYQLKGNYADNSFHISGNISPSTWDDPVVLDFSFHPSSSTTIDNDGSISDTDNGSTSSDDIPRLMSLYDGHLVAGYIDNDGCLLSDPTMLHSPSPTLLLLSLTDWSDLTSALNESTPTAASEIATAYTESELADGWCIPTEAEARYLSELYRADSERFDLALSAANADPIVLTDDRGNNLRYLCQDAEKTYSYKTSNVTNAGATIKTYHLRLVHTLAINR